MRNLGEDTVKCAGLQRVVQRDRDRMGRRAIMPQSDMASLFADHPVAEALQCADQTIRGYSPRQLQAASTGISSSFT